MFMFRKNRELQDKLVSYLTEAQDTLLIFRAGISDFVVAGLDGLDPFVAKVHAGESVCDTIRQQIEVDLFEKSLLPETREDLMVVMEELDKVVNQLESVVQNLQIERMELPEWLLKPYGELAALSSDCAEKVFQMAQEVILREGDPRRLAQQIGALESQSDVIEQRLVSELFKSDLTLAEKMFYRSALTRLAHIADRAEDVAVRLQVFLVKHL